jgi:hypothetical protein
MNVEASIGVFNVDDKQREGEKRIQQPKCVDV